VCVCRLTTWWTRLTTRRQTGFWRSTCSSCSGGCYSASQHEIQCRGTCSPGLRRSRTHPLTKCPRSAGVVLFWQLPTGTMFGSVEAGG
jgi:hypothetical protein